MGNYISSKYNYYFENQNKYKNIDQNEESLHSPLSTISGQSFDQDCPDIFQSGFLVLPPSSNNEPVRNLDYLKNRYQELLIYNSYLKLEYNNCRQDNSELLEKIEKLERQNIYFKQKIYNINTTQNPFKNRRKTV
jgi:hypothetical protein